MSKKQLISEIQKLEKKVSKLESEIKNAISNHETNLIFGAAIENRKKSVKRN